jgi:hypothetical protein
MHVFGQVHSLRQRRAMRHLLCQVCPSDDGARAYPFSARVEQHAKREFVLSRRLGEPSECCGRSDSRGPLC